MPIQHAIWKVGETPEALPTSRLSNEQQLEDMIVLDSRILSAEWMLIGRQEITSHGGRIDLLAMTPDGSLVLVELKRNRTPRDIVAQALDYASWVDQLSPDRIAKIYHRFSNGGNLDIDFKNHFGTELDEETLNQSHQIIIVAAELDDATERIVEYLNARDIAINVVFFQVFQSGDQKLLSRAWLIDPGETQANVSATAKSAVAREPWNGEYYVSYGPTDIRSWDDARNYGFIDASGGKWYTQTLKLLSPGDRVWVNIPKTGFVGVGEVTESVCSINDFRVNGPDGEQPILELLKYADHYRESADQPELAAQFVRVKWLDTASEAEAFYEIGLFGNQNTVCQPTTPKWRHTIDRLKTRFPKWQD